MITSILILATLLFIPGTDAPATEAMEPDPEPGGYWCCVEVVEDAEINCIYQAAYCDYRAGEFDPPCE